MALYISSGLLAQIRAHADAAPENEVCGLLIGIADAVTNILPADNIAAEPQRHFELEPAVLLQAHRAHRAGGHSILGHYHSHPSGSARPSVEDADCAMPDGRTWLIVAGTTINAWRAVENGLVHNRFNPETLVVTQSDVTGACIGE